MDSASPELIMGVAGLVYATGLAVFRLPLPQLRRWGWTLMMHSWSSVAVFSAIGSLLALKPYIAGLLKDIGVSIPLTATFQDAVASATDAKDVAFNWIRTVNLAALALGGIYATMLIAFSLLAALGGVGVILATIASLLVSTTFALLAFLQKILSGVVLLMESVVAIVLIAEKLAPALFTLGITLFAIPFARKAGKTMLVLGAALAIALPPAIVAVAPSPAQAERSIREAADIQALSIASKYVSDIQGGVRYTVYDRENKTLWYPYMELEPAAGIAVDSGRICADLPPANMTCDQLVELVKEMLKTPEKMILDTGGQGYYDAYNYGYRTTLTDNMTYIRKVWFLNMWVKIHDPSPRNISALEVPKESDPEAMRCVSADWYGTVADHPGATGCKNPYQMWKERWEGFWKSTKLYNETALYMVSANKNTTFVWFTEQPWGTRKEDLNLYGITLHKVREERWRENETYTCETDGNSTTVETCWRWKYYTRTDYSGNKSVYFVYLNDTKWSYQFIPLSNIPSWSHIVVDSSFQEIMDAGLIDGYGPYTLPQSIQAVNRDEPLTLEAPTEEKKVLVTANQTLISSSYDGYPEHPDSLSYKFRIVFTASDTPPYLPKVDWDRLEDDEKYVQELSEGKYVPSRFKDVNIETFREEWARYKPFGPGLYRDGPTQEAQRRINQKFLDYRNESWRTGETIFGSVPIAGAVSNVVYDSSYGVYGRFRPSNIGLETLGLVMDGGGAVGVLRPVSELVGTAFAMAIVLILFAIAVDATQAFVGGQSILMGFFMGQAGRIAPAMHVFGRFMSAAVRGARVNMVGRLLARRAENRMLKTASEMRVAEADKWQRIVQQRLEQFKRDRTVIGAKLSSMRVKMHERLLGWREGLRLSPSLWAPISGRLVDSLTRNYRLESLKYALRHDQEFQRTFMTHYARRHGLDEAVKVARAVKQASPVRVGRLEFAEGLAEAIKSTHGLERLAMADTLARSLPEIRSAYVKSIIGQPIGWVAGKIAKPIYTLADRLGDPQPLTLTGMTLDSVRDGLDGRLTAPAWVSAAANRELGITPQPSPGGFTVRAWGAGVPSGLENVKDPLNNPSGPGERWTDDFVEFAEAVRRYGSTKDFTEFLERSARHLEPNPQPAESKADSSYFTVDWSSGGKSFTVEYEAPRERAEDFVEFLESHRWGDARVVGYSVSTEPPKVSAEDSHYHIDDSFHNWWMGREDRRG